VYIVCRENAYLNSSIDWTIHPMMFPICIGIPSLQAGRAGFQDASKNVRVTDPSASDAIYLSIYKG